MTLLKTSHEGYLVVDHRASPGLPEAVARRNGLDPAWTKEGKLYEAATLGCIHCGTCFVKNPFRTRERAHCFKCNRYICDACEAVSREPDYEHRTFQDVREMIASGKYVVLPGSTASRPRLLKVNP